MPTNIIHLHVVSPGNLFILPCPLGELSVFAQAHLSLLSELRYFVVENERTARRFLIRMGYPLQHFYPNFFILNEHDNGNVIHDTIMELKSGKDVGLMSDAGVPCIADPGHILIRACHENNIKVHPVAGHSSIEKAIISSGFHVQKYTFNGYLPAKPDMLKKKLNELCKEIVRNGTSHFFIETPYRNNALLQYIYSNCQKNLGLSLAMNLDSPDEFIYTTSISEWEEKNPIINKVPIVFGLGVWNK